MECPRCRGTGSVTETHKNNNCGGAYKVSGTCGLCDGTGKVILVRTEPAKTGRPYKYYKPDYSTGGGGCFITTATCQNIQGLEKSETILNDFRFFRDNWLLNQNNGLEDIESYYKKSPPIVEKINMRQDKDDIYQIIWREHLSKIHDLILSAKNREAFDAYYHMVKWLEKI